jgi:O-antigen ligase
MRPSLRPRPTPLLWSWVALVGLVALANLRSLDLQTALWGSFERGDGFVTLFWVFVYFLVASVVMRQGVSRRRVLGAWVFSMTTVSVLATSQYGFALLRGHLDFRASGPLGNAGYLASCLVLSLFMVVGLYAETRRPAMRRLLVAAGWLQLFALLLASSRGAFAGLAVAAGLLLRESDDKQLRRGAWQVLTLCSAAVLLGAIVLGPKMLGALDAERTLPKPTEAEHASRGPLARFSSTSGGEQRLRIYSLAAEAILAAPITGHGQGSFDIVVDQNWDPRLVYGGRLDKPHSVPLRWAFIAGIPGLLAFLAIVGFAGVQVLNSSERPLSLRRAAMLGGLVAYTINGLFWFDTIASYALVAIVFAWIQGTASPAPNEGSERVGGSNRRVIALATGVSILAVGGWTSVAPVRAAWMIATAEQAAIEGRLEPEMLPASP